jgi:sporulation protein YhbH
MDNFEQPYAFIARRDWSLDRRGAQDEARHNEKVKESIRDHLEDVVSDGNIITVDPTTKKTIKVPMRSLELPRYRFGDDNEGIGSGDGSEKAGDVIGTRPGKNSMPGKGKAGEQPGVEYYETEIAIEELQQMVFEDLGLPRVKPKSDNLISTEELTYDDIRKKRTTNNLDLGRTILQNITRNAQETGKAEVRNIIPDDYRVRTWQERVRPENNAVVVAMADISGSMGNFEKYVTRAFCWWTVGFLRTKYPGVEIVFIAHDTEAHEVTEEEFFARGSSGGTKCSSANEMALQMVKNRYPTSRYNVYPLHFSDGDNYFGDNEQCVRLVKQLLDYDVNQYAYIQIGAAQASKLLNEYNSNIDDERFKGLMIHKKEDVLAALKQVFNGREGEG